MSSPMSIRVLLVDDHEMVRQGLGIFLNASPNITVIGQAQNGLEAIQLVQQDPPDVILMDLIMPEMDGVQATRRIKAMYPDIEIIALTSYVDEAHVVDALSAGVAGYVMKDVKPAELVRAICAAAQGEMYLSPAAARLLAKRVSPANSPEPLPEVLTERELDVLRLIARGLSNQDIANDLSISAKTVKTHISAILQKLNLTSRTQAALYALRRNLVPLND
jgi:two-component system, NarL family, response regulator LiaR